MTIETLVPDDLWQTIQPLLTPPPRRYGGRARVDDRACLAGHRLPAPHRHPPAAATHPAAWLRQLGHLLARRHDWQRAGVWQRLHHLVLDQLGRNGQLDWSRASLDPSASAPSVGGADRSQSGRPWQARVQVPPAGRPARRPVGGGAVGGQHPRLAAARAGGRRRAFDQGPAGPTRAAPQAPPGQGYDYPRCRRALRRRGITPRIARRGLEPRDRLGRHRYVVGYRRLQVRYERHAEMLLGFLHLACALICLKAQNQTKV
jgi:transposase